MRISEREYLDSKVWKFRRGLALWWASYRCQLCYTDKRPLDAHHRTYIRLGRERLTDLTICCRDCHEQYHHRTFDFDR
jgi:5-methylcytosine-specific restriction endonuclease McrA